MAEWQPFIQKVTSIMEKEKMPFEYVDVWVSNEDRQPASSSYDDPNGPRMMHVAHATRSDTDLFSLFTLYHMNQFGDYSANFSFPPGLGLPGRVFKTGVPTWDDHVQMATLTDFPRLSGAQKHGVRKALGIPLYSTTAGMVVVCMYTNADIPKDDKLMQKCTSLFQNCCPEARWELPFESDMDPVNVFKNGSKEAKQNIPPTTTKQLLHPSSTFCDPSTIAGASKSQGHNFPADMWSEREEEEEEEKEDEQKDSGRGNALKFPSLKVNNPCQEKISPEPSATVQTDISGISSVHPSSNTNPAHPCQKRISPESNAIVQTDIPGISIVHPSNNINPTHSCQKRISPKSNATVQTDIPGISIVHPSSGIIPAHPELFRSKKRPNKDSEEEKEEQRKDSSRRNVLEFPSLKANNHCQERISPEPNTTVQTDIPGISIVHPSSVIIPAHPELFRSKKRPNRGSGPGECLVTDISSQMAEWQPFIQKVTNMMQKENMPFEYVDVWVPREDQWGGTGPAGESSVEMSDVSDASTKAAHKQTGNLGDPMEEFTISGTLSTICKPKGLRMTHVAHATRNDTDLFSLFTLYHMNQFGDYSTKFSFPPGIGLPGRVFKSGLPTWDDQVQESTIQDFPRLSGAQKHGVRKALGIPLYSPTAGRVVIAMYTAADITCDNGLMQKCTSLFTHCRPEARWELVVESDHPFIAAQKERMGRAGGAGGLPPSDIDMKPLDIGAATHSDTAANHASSTTAAAPSDAQIATFLGRRMPRDVRDGSDAATNFVSLRLLLLREPFKRTATEAAAINMVKKSYLDYKKSDRSGHEIARLLVHDWGLLKCQIERGASPAPAALRAAGRSSGVLHVTSRQPLRQQRVLSLPFAAAPLAHPDLANLNYNDWSVRRG